MHDDSNTMRIMCASLYATSDDGRVTSPHRSSFLSEWFRSAAIAGVMLLFVLIRISRKLMNNKHCEIRTHFHSTTHPSCGSIELTALQPCRQLRNYLACRVTDGLSGPRDVQLRELHIGVLTKHAFQSC